MSYLPTKSVGNPVDGRANLTHHDKIMTGSEKWQNQNPLPRTPSPVRAGPTVLDYPRPDALTDTRSTGLQPSPRRSLRALGAPVAGLCFSIFFKLK